MSKLFHVTKYDYIHTIYVLQIVTVYIIAVNEEQFVEEHLPDFKKTTWAYLTE